MKYVWGLSLAGLLERADAMGYAADAVTEDVIDAVRDAILSSTAPEVVDDVIYNVLSRHLGAPEED